MAEVAEFVKRARLLREKCRAELQTDRSPLSDKENIMDQTSQLLASETPSPRAARADFSLEMSSLSRLPAPRLKEAPPKSFILSATKIVREMMPSERATDRITVFNKSRTAVEVAVRVNEAHGELSVSLGDRASQRVEIRPLGQVVMEVQIMASDDVGKSFSTIQLEGCSQDGRDRYYG